MLSFSRMASVNFVHITFFIVNGLFDDCILCSVVAYLPRGFSGWIPMMLTCPCIRSRTTPAHHLNYHFHLPPPHPLQLVYSLLPTSHNSPTWRISSEKCTHHHFQNLRVWWWPGSASCRRDGLKGVHPKESVGDLLGNFVNNWRRITAFGPTNPAQEHGPASTWTSTQGPITAQQIPTPILQLTWLLRSLIGQNPDQNADLIHLLKSSKPGSLGDLNGESLDRNPFQLVRSLGHSFEHFGSEPLSESGNSSGSCGW